VTDAGWPDGLVPLAAVVDALRDQLRAARAGADPTLPFTVGPILVELSAVARREADGRFGVKFWVVEAGGGGTKGSEITHKLTFTLTPTDPSSPTGDFRVGDPEGQPPPLPPGNRD